MATWFEKLKENGDEQIITMVLANKQDNYDDREVSEADGIKFAKKNNSAFFEVSAKTGYNINNAINTLVNEIASVIPKPSTDKQFSEEGGKSKSSKVSITNKE